MTGHGIVWRPAAIRQLKKLDRPLQGKIATAVDVPAADPRPTGVRNLADHPQFWWMKVDTIRVIYSITRRNSAGPGAQGGPSPGGLSEA